MKRNRRLHIQRRNELERRFRVLALRFILRGNFNPKAILELSFRKFLLFIQKQRFDFYWAYRIVRRRLDSEIAGQREEHFQKHYFIEHEWTRRHAVLDAKILRSSAPLEKLHQQISEEFDAQEASRRRRFWASSGWWQTIALWIRTRHFVEFLAVSGLVFISLSLISVVSLDLTNVLHRTETEASNDKVRILSDPPSIRPVSTAVELTLESEPDAKVAFPDRGFAYWKSGSHTQLIRVSGSNGAPAPNSYIGASVCTEDTLMIVGTASLSGSSEFNATLAQNRAASLLSEVISQCSSNSKVRNVILLALSDPWGVNDDGFQRRAVILSIRMTENLPRTPDNLERALIYLSQHDFGRSVPVFSNYLTAKFSVVQLPNAGQEDLVWKPMHLAAPPKTP